MYCFCFLQSDEPSKYCAECVNSEARTADKGVHHAARQIDAAGVD